LTDFNAETRDNRAHSFPDVRHRISENGSAPATASASNEIFTDIGQDKQICLDNHIQDG
jgi:hypothetical protein